MRVSSWRSPVDERAFPARSARQRVDVLLPARDQAASLGARAVLRVVVVDQLDLLEVGHVAGRPASPCSTAAGTGWSRRRTAAPAASAPIRRTSSPARGCFAPLTMLIEPISAPVPSDGVTVSTGKPCIFSLRAVVHEADRDRGLAARHRLDRPGARARVLADVPVQALQVLEGLVLAHQLHQRRDHRVGGAARRRVRDLDLALVLGLEQVGPALRHGELLLREQLGVVAEAERPGIDADGLVARLLGLLLRPRRAAAAASPTCIRASGRSRPPAGAGRRCRRTRRRSSGSPSRRSAARAPRPSPSATC